MRVSGIISGLSGPVLVVSMATKVYLQTQGCQMNEYDSAKMFDVLAAAEGAERVDDPAAADLLLLNTCSIRGWGAV